MVKVNRFRILVKSRSLNGSYKFFECLNVLRIVPDTVVSQKMRENDALFIPQNNNLCYFMTLPKRALTVSKVFDRDYLMRCSTLKETLK